MQLRTLGTQTGQALGFLLANAHIGTHTRLLWRYCLLDNALIGVKRYLTFYQYRECPITPLFKEREGVWDKIFYVYEHTQGN